MTVPRLRPKTNVNFNVEVQVKRIQERTCVWTILAMLALCTFFAVGCVKKTPSDSPRKETADRPQSSDLSAEKTASVSPSPALAAINDSYDVGIVFANEEGYSCIPLDHYGFAEDMEIVSVSSSCECITPILIDYFASDSSVQRALRLNFNAEDSPPAQEDAPGIPANLGVIIEFELADGSITEKTVTLLHTWESK